MTLRLNKETLRVLGVQDRRLVQGARPGETEKDCESAKCPSGNCPFTRGRCETEACNTNIQEGCFPTMGQCKLSDFCQSKVMCETKEYC